ncbi:MAG: prepilin-type N-terminal cleavage/methylation domain-containing protein [bacterium]|nr:prepilin-type N-terminal cleavage/methylation domain-containing protein [bacterium]
MQGVLYKDRQGGETLGTIYYKDIRRWKGRAALLKENGFTLMELLVVIAVIAILASILFPVFNKVREKGRQVTCQSNLRQIGMAMLMYAQDYDSCLPMYQSGGYFWYFRLSTYLSRPLNQAVGVNYLICPSLDSEKEKTYGVTGTVSYGANYGNVFNTTKPCGVDEISLKTFLVGDAVGTNIYSPKTYPFKVDSDGDGINDTTATWSLPYNRMITRHNGGANFVFADGSVRWIALSKWLANSDDIWGP